jgi:hypothetical protein
MICERFRLLEALDDLQGQPLETYDGRIRSGTREGCPQSSQEPRYGPADVKEALDQVQGLGGAQRG